jgi:hypothetical protein
LRVPLPLYDFSLAEAEGDADFDAGADGPEAGGAEAVGF